jgi:anthranilate phosphoribosyltransferase
MDIRDLLSTLQNGEDLDSARIEFASAFLLQPDAADADKAAILEALAKKGESPEEIAGFVRCFLRHAVPLPLDPARLSGPTIDVCGTGGDHMNLFNVSTTVLFILAGGGAHVLKHGNRGITSRSGGADALEALGVPLDQEPAAAAESVQRAGAAFLFAPRYHPAFKAVANVRKELAGRGIRTIFNILGPLLNPAHPQYQLVGVFSDRLLQTYKTVLALLGRKGAWIVYGRDAGGKGIDEISTVGPTTVHAFDSASEREFTITPAELGVATPDIEELRGGDAKQNAAITEGILNGTIKGAKRDLVAVNAAAAFTLCELSKSLEEGLLRAHEAIDSGNALRTLDRMRSRKN